MLNLTQRLTVGFTLLVALSLTLAIWVHRVLVPSGEAGGHAPVILWLLSGSAILVATLTLIYVLRPIQQLGRDIRRIASGDLTHRTEWGSAVRSNDSFGQIASEIDRFAVRLRELRETEAGRRQMEFQLSDAVLQSIFEPIIVTDSKGYVLKINQSAAEVLGSAATDRMALTNTPGGDKILEAIRNAVSMQRAVAAEDDAAMLPMRIGERERSYRLRTMPMRDSEGRLLGTVTTLEDVTILQDTDRFKTQFIAVASPAARSAAATAARPLRARMGFAGELRPFNLNWFPPPSRRREKLDDLMTELIEVAELDSGKREPELERLLPSRSLSRPAIAHGRGPAHSVPRRDSAPSPISRTSRPIVAPYAPFSTICSATRCASLPADGEIFLRQRSIKDSFNSPCATLAPGLSRRPTQSHFRPLQLLLRKRHRPGVGPCAAAGRVARRPDLRREPARPWSHFPFHTSGRRGERPVIRSRWAKHGDEPTELQIERQQEPARLRIYIGAAPGVGKTYHMLNDAHLLREAGRRYRDRTGRIPWPQRNRSADPRPGDRSPARDSLSRRRA